MIEYNIDSIPRDGKPVLCYCRTKKLGKCWLIVKWTGPANQGRIVTVPGDYGLMDAYRWEPLPALPITN